MLKEFEVSGTVVVDMSAVVGDAAEDDCVSIRLAEDEVSIVLVDVLDSETVVVVRATIESVLVDSNVVEAVSASGLEELFAVVVVVGTSLKLELVESNAVVELSLSVLEEMTVVVV